MGGDTPKPLLPLDEVPILFHTLARLRATPGWQSTILAVHPEELAWYQEEWENSLRQAFGVSAILAGGTCRRESVRRALQAAPPDPPIVLVHDAVRPLVRLGVIESTAARANSCGAAVAATPAVCTIKKVDSHNKIIATPPRGGLWMAQTPQAFSRDLLLKAHRHGVENEIPATDDASLVEQLGEKPEVVESSGDNLKITSPEDLAVAEAILQWQRGQKLPAARLSLPDPAEFPTLPG
jgi:2-C-methyl-D-erythritol 4-phosphate cytidylyltransferase